MLVLVRVSGWVVGGGRVACRRAQRDGGPKMGAHGAGRAACHASSPKWALKRPLALFPRRETTASLSVRVLFIFPNKSSSLFLFYFFPDTRLLKFAAFAEKKSHHTPFSMHTASSAFEVCVAMLRCVTYSSLLQRSSAGDRMCHSELNGLHVCHRGYYS